MNTPLPLRLHAAYEWTRAAGELDELRSLAKRPRKLAAYCRDSEANALECARDLGNGVTDVSASDLADLAAWLAS